MGKCIVFKQHANAAIEPLLETGLSERPRQKVATDFLEDKGKISLLVADYYSKLIEVIYMYMSAATSRRNI